VGTHLSTEAQLWQTPTDLRQPNLLTSLENSFAESETHGYSEGKGAREERTMVEATDCNLESQLLCSPICVGSLKISACDFESGWFRFRPGV